MATKEKSIIKEAQGELYSITIELEASIELLKDYLLDMLSEKSDFKKRIKSAEKVLAKLKTMNNASKSFK